MASSRLFEVRFRWALSCLEPNRLLERPICRSLQRLNNGVLGSALGRGTRGPKPSRIRSPPIVTEARSCPRPVSLRLYWERSRRGRHTVGLPHAPQRFSRFNPCVTLCLPGVQLRPLVWSSPSGCHRLSQSPLGSVGTPSRSPLLCLRSSPGLGRGTRGFH